MAKLIPFILLFVGLCSTFTFLWYNRTQIVQTIKDNLVFAVAGILSLLITAVVFILFV